eukprot:6712802-Alexandrium_andersonii.AAC.1
MHARMHWRTCYVCVRQLVRMIRQAPTHACADAPKRTGAQERKRASASARGHTIEEVCTCIGAQ